MLDIRGKLSNHDWHFDTQGESQFSTNFTLSGPLKFFFCRMKHQRREIRKRNLVLRFGHTRKNWPLKRRTEDLFIRFFSGPSLVLTKNKLRCHRKRREWMDMMDGKRDPALFPSFASGEKNGTEGLWKFYSLFRIFRPCGRKNQSENALDRKFSMLQLYGTSFRKKVGLPILPCGWQKRRK